MIKINTDAFDWNEIYKIYKAESNGLIELLRTNINDKYAASGTHQVVKNLLIQWFFYEGIISTPKISEYLLHDDPVDIINQFDTAISEILPPPDRDYASAITNWPIAKQSAIQLNTAQERKDVIASVIIPQNVHLFSGISCDELNHEPLRGTIYSNKAKITEITLLCESEIEKIKEELSEIFNYADFATRFRDRLLSAMHIEVCPYCNRQYITIFKDDNIFRSTADIDHFYSKDRYPFLALSLYNFVPSCQICNSRFKLTADFGHKKHIYPFKRGFDSDGIFKLDNIDCLLGNMSQYKSIQFGIENPNNIEEIGNSIATFHLKEVYASHQDYVGELIKKVKLYSNGQLEEYLEQFGDLFESKGEMQRIVFGNYVRENELGKRPLAKLTKDLLDDLGMRIEE